VTLWLDALPDDPERQPIEELQRQNRLLRALYALGDVLIADSPLERIYDAAISALIDALEADRATILRFDHAGVMRFRAWRGLSDGYRLATDGHSPWARDTLDPEPVLIGDAASDPSLSEPLRQIVLHEGIRALAFIPIVYHGRLLGKFMLYFDRPHRFDGEEIMIARAVAGHIAFALGRAEAARELATSRDRLALLQRVTAALSGAVTPDEVAQVILTHGVVAVGATGGGVARLAEDGATLQIIGTVGHAPPEPYRRELPLAANTPLATAARTGESVWIESTAAWQEFDPATARVVMEAGGSSWAALPLLAEGRVLGSLGLAFSAPRPFDEDERALLLALSDQCAQSLRRALLYEAERIAREQAQEATRIRDEFLSVASHELRTPLTSLQARAQLAIRRINRDGVANVAQVTTAFDEIRRQTERLGALITQLLDVSRLQAGRLTLTRGRLDLVALVSEVIASLPENAEHSVELRAPAHLLAEADGLRLEQVLTNILDNAVKYSPNGGRIEVGVRALGPLAAEIAVRDHGLGIPPERRAAIFERYYRAHTDSYQSGLGLGLYISRQIVELHGGTITAEFPDDGGARFVIVLPTDGPAASTDARTGIGAA
jgi:signal transduction histidine kinase